MITRGARVWLVSWSPPPGAPVPDVVADYVWDPVGDGFAVEFYAHWLRYVDEGVTWCRDGAQDALRAVLALA